MQNSAVLTLPVPSNISDRAPLISFPQFAALRESPSKIRDMGRLTECLDTLPNALGDKP